MALLPHNPSKMLHQTGRVERHPDVTVTEVAGDSVDLVEDVARAQPSGRAAAINRNVN